MNSYLEQYLKEKEEYYFPQEKEIISEEIENNSDPILNADEFMYSNTDMQTSYARGKGFKITDAQDFYEVIKQVKDITDKHLYIRSLVWDVDIKGNKIHFNFVLGDKISNEFTNKFTDEFFINGIEQSILLSIYKKFPKEFKVDSKKLEDKDGFTVLKITLEKIKDKDNNTGILKLNPPNSPVFSGKYSSISNM